MSDAPPPIIIRRVRKRGHRHHGGAWKVAYADFVTAMMAFFLVMWIVGAGSRQQKAAISDYFRNPSATPGNTTVAPPGRMGPGGASDSMIKLGGAMDLSHGPGKDHHNGPTGAPSKAEIERRARELDRARLQELKEQLNAAIQNSQALAPFKDQLLLDITPEGLRIQIVDKLNRPMFDLGSARLKDYTRAILGELARFINRVPNHISIIGHTDDAPYGNDNSYSNWELSTDRANAARRALIAGGLLDDKVARVVGLAASVPLDKTNPGNPINRRISIIVMTKDAEAAALSSGMADNAPTSGPNGPLPAAAGPATPDAPARGAHAQATPAAQPATAIATLPVAPTLRAEEGGQRAD
jgi:chemotaxis protein MotB